MDVSLSIDIDGDACLRRAFHRSETDQYNEWYYKVFKGGNRPSVRFSVWRGGWGSSLTQTWKIILVSSTGMRAGRWRIP